MRKVERWGRILGLAASMLYSQHGEAVVLNSVSVPVGQTLDITPSDTAVTTMASYVRGILNNQGSIKAGAGIMVPDGILNNHGLIQAENYLSSGPQGKIINHADGQISLMSWMDLYGDSSLFENAGRFVVGPSPTSQSITVYFRGTIKNTGTMIFDRNRQNSLNVCGSPSGIGYFINEGLFDIENGTVCDFIDLLASSSRKISYTQNAGETKVNGTFGVDEITVNKGILSGNGMIKGNFLNKPLADGVTIASGAPLGTLSIVPEEGYLSCLRCSIDIELAGDTQSDQLHVEGELYMNGWKLNVLLRDGYIPTPGTRFNIVTTTMVLRSSAPISNLPKLPNGRTWSVQNTGTEIILTAN